MYERLAGPIPEGLTLDHLCENKDCVNPDHLDPCDRGENVRRHFRKHPKDWSKSHCGVCGADKSGAGGYVRPDGRGIDCTACRRIHDRRRKAKKRKAKT